MKTCSSCTLDKSLDEFDFRSGKLRKDGTRNTFLRGVCRECINAQARDNYAKRPSTYSREKNRRNKMKMHYGMSSDRYDAILQAQSGGCAICGTQDPGGRYNQFFHVDHDHSCCDGNKSCGDCIRGLLCSNCNAGIGLLQDNPDLLLSAAAYLLAPLQEPNTEGAVNGNV